MCSGNASGTVIHEEPNGGKTTYQLGGTWKKVLAEGTLEVTVPSGSPAAEVSMDMRDAEGNLVRTLLVKFPANTSQEPLIVKASGKDPWVVQVPVDWDLTGLTYASPTGSVAATLTPGPVPRLMEMTPTGLVPTGFYTPELGYKHYLVEVPEWLHATGMHEVSAVVECLPAARRVDTIKVLETGVLSAASFAQKAFFPLFDGVIANGDFATYQDPFLVFDIELGGPPCEGPSGHTPRLSTPAGVSWALGTNGELEVLGLDPASPVAVMAGGVSYLDPGIPAPGFGCFINASPDATLTLGVTSAGSAQFLFAVPANPALYGAALYWQAVQVFPGTSMLTSNVIKTVFD